MIDDDDELRWPHPLIRSGRQDARARRVVRALGDVWRALLAYCRPMINKNFQPPRGAPGLKCIIYFRGRNLSRRRHPWRGRGGETRAEIGEIVHTK